MDDLDTGNDVTRSVGDDVIVKDGESMSVCDEGLFGSFDELPAPRSRSNTFNTSQNFKVDSRLIDSRFNKSYPFSGGKKRPEAFNGSLSEPIKR